VIEAAPADVRLVVVDGVPLYGDRSLLTQLWGPLELQEIPVNGAANKTLAGAAAGLVVTDLAARLQNALEAEGTSLAPLTEP